MTAGSYQEYVEKAGADFAARSDDVRFMLVDALADKNVEKVLDVGCGAGQELYQFIERKNAFCVGVDVAEELGKIGNGFFGKLNMQKKVAFSRSNGSELPFKDESFDVVMCRVALPYMDNKKTIAEIARVLRPKGIFFLKTHAPAFYFGMLKRRSTSFNLKQYAYPLICLAGGTFHNLTGMQPKNGVWKGKEVFQTKGFLKREFAKNNLQIKAYLPDDNIQTPSLMIEKF